MLNKIASSQTINSNNSLHFSNTLLDNILKKSRLIEKAISTNALNSGQFFQDLNLGFIHKLHNIQKQC